MGFFFAYRAAIAAFICCSVPPPRTKRRNSRHAVPTKLVGPVPPVQRFTHRIYQRVYHPVAINPGNTSIWQQRLDLWVLVRRLQNKAGVLRVARLRGGDHNIRIGVRDLGQPRRARHGRVGHRLAVLERVALLGNWQVERRRRRLVRVPGLRLGRRCCGRC